MSDLLNVLVILLAWLVVSCAAALIFGRFFKATSESEAKK